MDNKFTHEQMDEQKKSLHSALFWLLLYKDPKTSASYEYMDVNRYIDNLIIRFSGLNELFGYPPVMITILSLLESIKVVNKQEPFDYAAYRKLVLDAQALIDQLDKDGDAYV